MMMVRYDGICLDIYDNGTYGHLFVLVRLRIYRFWIFFDDGTLLTMVYVWIIMMMVRY